jgi:hypothetical protein
LADRITFRCTSVDPVLLALHPADAIPGRCRPLLGEPGFGDPVAGRVGRNHDRLRAEYEALVAAADIPVLRTHINLRRGTYVRYVDWVSTLTDARLDSLYQADGFGGEKTMRARVIRELIDEIRALRRRLSELDSSAGGSCPEPR